MTKAVPKRGAAPRTLELQRFMPYRLAVLAEEVSRSLAQLYADRFDLTRQEWRVLAGLADMGEIPATDVAEYATLDKMSVSRAVASLEEKGHLTREEDPGDRRNKILRMTPSGAALYAKIAPLALAREEYLLEPLSPADRAAFERIMSTLLARARNLQRRG